MRTFIFSSVLLIGLPIQAVGEVSPGEAEQSAHLWLHGMEDARSRLRSGQFHATGHRIDYGLDEESFERDVELDYAFDFIKELLRIDWDEPAKTLVLSKDPTDDASQLSVEALSRLGKFRIRDRLSKYVRTPTYSLHWSSDNERVVFQHDPDNKRYLPLTRFDVRTLGLIGIHGFEDGISFADINKLLLERKVVNAVEEKPNGLARIEWEKRHIRREMWIDQGRGYSPVYLAIRRRTGSRDKPNWQGTPIEEVNLTWEKKSDVWMPKTYSHRLLDGKNLMSSISLTLEWKSANEPLDDSLFTYQQLNVPVKAQVVSDQLGQPIIVGYAYPEDETPQTEITLQTDVTTRRRAIIYANVALVAILAIIVLLKRRSAAGSVKA